jgi:hypothetical protein
MNRIILIAIALTFFPATLFAQVSAKDDCDFDKPGAISVEELRKEPITFELDISYADTGNPRHRLDRYLPKKAGAPSCR